MKTLIDLVTPDESFWITSHGARFKVRRLTLQDKREIEAEVYKHGVTENDLSISYLKEWFRTAADKTMDALAKAEMAEKIGAKLAELERKKELSLSLVDNKSIDRVLLDWDDSVGVGGVPVECISERKALLPVAVKRDILEKTSVRLNTRDDEKTAEEEEGNL